MNPLNRLKEAVSVPLNVFRDAPSAAQAAPRQRPVAAIAKTAWDVALIEARDMRSGAFLGSNVWSTVGYFTVPEGVRYKLPAGLSYRLYLKALTEVVGANGVSASRAEVLPDLVDTPRSKPALPSLYHPDVQVWCQVGGVWSQVAVDALNYGTRTVTFTEPTNCTNIEIYHVTGAGQWRFRAQRELGNSDTNAATIVNGSMAATHLVDQNNSETSHKWPQETQLIPAQRLTVEVYSTLKHVFNERAQQVVILNSRVQQIEVINKDLLRRAAEIDVRGGV